MKKLLEIIGSIALFSGPVTAVISCTSDKPNVEKKSNDVLNKLEEEEKKNQILQIDIDKDENNIEVLKKALRVKTNINIKKGYSLDIEKVNDSSLDDDGKLTIGTFKAKLKKDDTVLSLGNKNHFTFRYARKDKLSYSNIINVLSNQSDKEFNLSNLKLNIDAMPEQLKNLDLQGILGYLIQPNGLIINSNLIPNTIPKTEEDWKKWKEFVDSIENSSVLKNFVLDGKKLEDIVVNETLKVNESHLLAGKVADLELTIKFNVREILNLLAFDIIHLNNYMKEKNKLGNDNFILNLIQYLLQKPQNINNDGYMNDSNETYNENARNAQTNLEHMLYSFFKGIKVTDGISKDGVNLTFKIDGKAKDIINEIYEKKETILNNIIQQLISKFLGEVDISKTLNIKIDPKEWNIQSDAKVDLFIKTISIKGTVLDKIADLINDKLKLPINEYIEKYLLPEYIKLVSNDITADDIANNEIKIIGGKAIFEGKTSDGEWTEIKNLDDIKNNNLNKLRLVLKNLKLNIKSKTLTKQQIVVVETDADKQENSEKVAKPQEVPVNNDFDAKDIIINLDLSSSVFGQ